MMKKNIPMFLAGLFCGAALFGGSVAYAAGILATPTTDLDQRITLDGQEIELIGYVINGNNYFQLRDLGDKLGFGVSWDNDTRTVVITTEPTGQTENPANVATTADPYHAAAATDSRYQPKVGDQILCDDGSTYTITDVSRWDKNMFQDGPLPELPTATCDWSLMPQVELPAPEVRRYSSAGQDYLFARNIYESRRMLYTLFNAIGDNPETWKDGKPVLHPSGNAKVKISFTIPTEITPQTFWPWRSSEITNLFNSCPPGTYYMEAWDVYKNGVFQRTEYNIMHRI